jgi:hypothetical protein
MENNISKVNKENAKNVNNKEQFSWIMQSLSFLIGTSLAFLIVLPLIILIYLSKMNTNANSIYEALIWASIGGFFGGAARSMFKYIRQVNNRNVDEVFWRLRRWFLYLLKPFMGIAGGVLFFLLVNSGLVGFFTQQALTFELLPVLLVSSTGGVFFEDVFLRLGDMIHKSDK